MTRPVYKTLDAAAEETAALREAARNAKWTGGFSQQPYFHIKDRLIGGLAGGIGGYGLDKKIQGDDDSTASTARHLTSAALGALIGGRGLNAVGNVARRYIANTSPLEGYALKSIPKTTLKGIWEHGFKDVPGPAVLGQGGIANPRYELFRRYLGLHEENPVFDYFVRNRDGSLSFNPKTTSRNSPFYKHYIEPGLQEPGLAATFKPDVPSPRPSNRSEPTTKMTPATSSLIVTPEQASRSIPKTLVFPGMPGEPAARRLFTSSESPVAKVTRTANTELPQFKPDLDSLRKPPGYSVESGSNPFSSIFGSHDTRHIPGSARTVPGGGARTAHEIGDTWNLAIDPHEAPEYKAYLKGLLTTSPGQWRNYLQQPASLGHNSAFTGFGVPMPSVGDRLKTYAMRDMTERFLRQNSPVIRQRAIFNYERPSAFLHAGEPEVTVQPNKVYFAGSNLGLAPQLPNYNWMRPTINGATLGYALRALTTTPSASQPQQNV